MKYYQAKIFVVLTLVTVIAACSFKTFYNNLDYLIPEYVEDRVTLDDVLEKKFKHRTELLLYWHRSSQLIQYAGWMRSLQKVIGTQLTEDIVEQRIAEAEQFWQTLSEKLNREMADLLPLLNKHQQQELFENLKDDNEDFREEHVELEKDERQQQYFDDLYETYENWIGDLSEQQELLIKQAAMQLDSTMALRLQRRQLWQKGIQEILQSEAGEKVKSQRLAIFFAEFDDQESTELQEKSALNKSIIIQLTVQIAHKMDKEQTEFFLNKTNEYIRLFTELAENH